MLKYSKIVIFSTVIGCFFALLFLFDIDLLWGKFSKVENVVINMNASETHKKQSKGEYQSVKQSTNRGSMRQSGTAKSNEPLPHDPADYYQIIVDNNIFRPLGWTPPKEEPQYTLIGTSFDPTGDKSEAFVLEERSNQFHIVSVGDKIGDVIVKEIAEKTVSLYKDGELITLNSRRVGFLGSVGRGHNNSSPRNEGNVQNVRNNDRGSRSKSANMNADRKKMEKILKENEKAYRASVKKAANAERKLEQAKRKATVKFEGKKILAVDFELKMKSK